MPWIRPLLLTLQLMTCSVLLAAIMGLTIAFSLALVSTKRRGGRFVLGYCLLALIACLATPMVLHAAAWEATAGKFGWLTFTQTAARTYQGLAGQYSGMVACVWIHGLFGAAMVALAAWFATRRVSREVIDVSLIDGGPVWGWWCVRLPIAAPWVITALLATAILSATEMTVVDLYGVRTLADEFYLFHAVNPSAMSILSVLVLPGVLAVAAVCTWVISRRPEADVQLLDPVFELADASDSAVAESDPGTAASRVLAWSAAGVALVLTTMMCLFPLAGLVIKTGQQVSVRSAVGPTSPVSEGAPAELSGGLQTHWSPGQTMRVLAKAPMEFRREYRWTAILAMGTIALCVPIGWGLASWARRRRRWDLVILAMTLVAFMIPGPLVGLAIVRFFALPVPGFYGLFHQSLLPTLIALSVRAIPVSYWVMRAGYAGLDAATLDAARLDLSWGQRLIRIEAHLLVRPLMIAGFAVAVVACGDVPVTLPVVPPEVVTVGTRLFALLHSGARERESALAFWYLAATVLAAGIMSIRWKRLK